MLDANQANWHDSCMHMSATYIPMVLRTSIFLLFKHAPAHASTHATDLSSALLSCGQERMWRFFLKLEADALLIRSAGMLQQLLDLGGTGAMVGANRIPQLFGDFSLNAANVIAAKGFLNEGISRLTPTHDLDAYQVRLHSR